MVTVRFLLTCLICLALGTGYADRVCANGVILEVELRNVLLSTSQSEPLTDFRMTETAGREYHVDNRGLISMTDVDGKDLGVFLDERQDPYFLDRIRFFSMRVDPLFADRAYVLASTWIDGTSPTPVIESLETGNDVDSHMVLLEYEINAETGAALPESRREVLRLEQHLNIGHVGGGMVFSAKGDRLFFTVGDHQNSRGTGVPGSQDDMASDGSLIALDPRAAGQRQSNALQGPDNPIYAIGLRNSQSLERDGDTLYFSNIGKTAAEAVFTVCPGCNYGWGAFVEGTFEIDEEGDVLGTLTVEELAQRGIEAPLLQVDRRGIGGYAISNVVCNSTTVPGTCFSTDLISGDVIAAGYDSLEQDRLIPEIEVRLQDTTGNRLENLNDLAPSPPGRVDARAEQDADGGLMFVLEVSGAVYTTRLVDTILLTDGFE